MTLLCDYFVFFFPAFLSPHNWIRCPSSQVLDACGEANREPKSGLVRVGNPEGHRLKTGCFLHVTRGISVVFGKIWKF